MRLKKKTLPEEEIATMQGLEVHAHAKAKLTDFGVAVQLTDTMANKK
jgi:hypothetical protein